MGKQVQAKPPVGFHMLNQGQVNLSQKIVTNQNPSNPLNSSKQLKENNGHQGLKVQKTSKLKPPKNKMSSFTLGCWSGRKSCIP